MAAGAKSSLRGTFLAQDGAVAKIQADRRQQLRSEARRLLSGLQQPQTRPQGFVATLLSRLCEIALGRRPTGAQPGSEYYNDASADKPKPITSDVTRPAHAQPAEQHSVDAGCRHIGAYGYDIAASRLGLLFYLRFA